MFKAYLLFKVAPGYEEEILQRLRKNKNVEEAYVIYGFYDIIARIKAETSDELYSVKRKIKAYRGVDELNFKTFTLAFT